MEVWVIHCQECRFTRVMESDHEARQRMDLHRELSKHEVTTVFPVHLDASNLRPYTTKGEA